ncbi:MAG TPA: tyrosine/phenylalanine carboxypeptidase domain-containing protein [Acidimicrobiia bacterium]|nr:tyrosine/phenylalanine carboxypeptidase domain-containing protein [Acidimicrobiia bacterium]
MSDSITDGDRLIDRELTRISEMHRFLVALTPTNTSQAREVYLAEPSVPPRFEYRDLGDLPEQVRDAAVAVDVTHASDPAIRHLFEQKRDELKLQAEMLMARCTDEFLPMSIELFGSVRPRLLETAQHILRSLPPVRAANRGCLDAAAVATAMRAALDRYLTDDAPPVAVVVRDDIAGVMVSNGDVLIGDSVSVAPSRLDGLVAHEIDTHVLTYLNGASQPLQLMSAGLAGYEETQEGLALIAEVVVEGLTRSRLRQLAARVVAVHRRIQDASFSEVHEELVDIGFSPSGAFGIAMRVFRSGGLTKDAGYLRALQALAEHLAHGGDLDALWMGKIALHDLSIVEELRERGLLVPPARTPLFLTDGEARRRVAEFATSVGIHELIGAET